MSYFEIGIYHPRNQLNIGTLWRSAYQLGAAGIFSIGRPYRNQSSDTARTMENIPLRSYLNFEEFMRNRAVGAVLVGVEIGGTPLASITHPKQAIYLLGSEDNGFSKQVLGACNEVISIESIRSASYNVAVSGSIVMYHRYLQFLK